MQPSPYTPGAVAREVPGRGQQLAEADERLSYLVDVGRLVTRIRVDYAARGVGKTSLLRQVARRAQDRGVATVWATAGELELDLMQAIGEGVGELARGWQAEARGRVREALGRMTLTVGVPGVAQVEMSGGREAAEPAAGARAFEHVLKEAVAAALRENHSGLVLFVDEIQDSDPAGLRTLAYAWQHLQSEAPDLRAAVFAAGLPNSPKALAAAVTFSERLFAYRQLGYLTDDAAQVALAGPAAAQGVAWGRDGLAEALAIAQGYPFFVQLVGETAWAAAGYPDPGGRISAAHVRAGQSAMREDVDALFRARWEKATPLEQQFMRAIAELGDGPVRRSDVAKLMGATSDAVSVPRQRLIDKGLIDVAGRGQLAFPLPGFGAYIRAHDDKPETAAPAPRHALDERRPGPTPPAAPLPGTNAQDLRAGPPR